MGDRVAVSGIQAVVKGVVGVVDGIVGLGRGLKSSGGARLDGVRAGIYGGLENSVELLHHWPKISRRAVMASSCQLQEMAGASWRACESSLRLWVMQYSAVTVME